jgi:hypothetical protein
MLLHQTVPPLGRLLRQKVDPEPPLLRIDDSPDMAAVRKLVVDSKKE